MPLRGFHFKLFIFSICIPDRYLRNVSHFHVVGFKNKMNAILKWDKGVLYENEDDGDKRTSCK